MASDIQGRPDSTGSNRLLLAGLVTMAALFSILYSGFAPFVNNNIYHLPILRADFDQPQFAQDAFVQSLRHFSSGLWLVLSGSAAHVPPKAVMIIGFLVSRLLMMAAALHFASSFGYKGNGFAALFLLLIAVSPFANGYAPGGGGLDVEYFTHSELANGTFFLSLSLAIRRRTALSVFLACLTFFLNAFMAVWLAPLFLTVNLLLIHRGEQRAGPMLRGALFGALAGLPFVLVVVHAVLGSTEPGFHPDYSYAAYLRGFFPFHFFLDSLPRNELFLLVLISVSALLASRLLAQRSQVFLALVLASLALLGVGSLMPLLTESRFILNLHFIRSAVLLQWLAVLGLAMGAAGNMTGRGSKAEQGSGALIAALLVFGTPVLPVLLLLLILLERLPREHGGQLLDKPLAGLLARGLFAAALAYSIPVAVIPAWQKSRLLWAISDQWERMGSWVAANTPAQSVFLLPVGTEAAPAGASAQSQSVVFDMAGFFATAGRSVWTNYKFGAAPMWAPSTYHIWRQRYDEVRDLPDAPGRLSYAATHGISHVITFCDPAVPAPPLHRDGDLCIYAVPKAGES